MVDGWPGAEPAPPASWAGSSLPPDRWLKVLVEAQQHIAHSGPTVDDAARALAQEAQRILGSSVLVSLLDGGHLRIAAVAGGPLGLGRGMRFAAEGTLSERCLRLGEPLVCHDLRVESAAALDFHDRFGVRSLVIVPLRYGSVALGVVVLAAEERGAFTQEDCDVLALLAYCGAAAMASSAYQTDLAVERLRLSAASTLTGTGLWRWDAVTDALQWSPEMFEITGLDSATSTPSLALWESMLHPEDQPRCDLVAHVGNGVEGHTETLRLRRADGSWRELVAWSRLVLDGDVPTGVFGATVDVTSQRLAEREVARLAARDGLTGLANRAVLDDLTRRCIATLPAPQASGDAAAQGDVAGDLVDGLGPLTALLLLDLDRFKLVNDTLGHTVGDALLVAVAERLTTALELSGVSDCSPTVARLGGDEFVVLLPWVAGVEAVQDVASWLLDEVRAPVVVAGAEMVCTGSIGVSVASHSARTASELFREADLAMYRAKAQGRDRIALYDNNLRAEAESRVRAERRLRGAIEGNRLVAVYQPIVSLADERVVGVEALARLVDDEGRLVLPEGFIDVAEDTGLVVDLDRWMLEQGITTLAEWAAEGFGGLGMQVNVSARTLSQSGFDEFVLNLLAENGVEHAALRLELTETSLLPGGSDAQDALYRLADVGIRTGIDDFGTGYSALAYLQDLPVDFIKVDRSFVSRLDGSARPSAVVQAVISLAHAHGYLVTAEGVETPQQAELLRDMGCDHAQGWLFGRPSVEHMPERTWVESRRGAPAPH